MPLVPGTTVRLVARSGTVGVVTGSRKVGPAVQVDVFHDGGVHSYFESQIEPTATGSKPGVVSAPQLRAGLTSELLRDAATSYLHARNVGRIDYEPYQYRPVLKIVQADRPRILIADDVGVGKTIEACLILKELQARQRAKRVLVICPKPLVVDHKWRNELRRFDEDFEHLDSADLRYCLEESHREGEWPARFAKAVLPFSLLDERLLAGGDGRNPRVGLVDLAPGPHFDLVIVDEAHHIRNPLTFRYQCVRQFTEAADAVVMLSATPLQTDSRDLFTLVNLLRDDLVPSERDFAQMLEPNEYLHEAVEVARPAQKGWQRQAAAALTRALATPWGQQVLAVEPKVRMLGDLLQRNHPTTSERVKAIRTLEDLNTFSSIVTRTRRRDIGEFTTRKPSAPVVAFTEQQRKLYDAVLDLGLAIADLQAPGMPIEFLVSMLRRQAASSISGLAPLIEQILTNRLDTIEWAEIGDDAPDQTPLDQQLRSQIHELGCMAQELGGGPDPKAEALRQVIADKQRAPNNKVLVFSTFRHTLAYLESKTHEWGVRVAVVHGAVPDDERYSLRRRFKLPKGDAEAIDVMLCSEVGTEGLDYQFCDMLVNYDIPWNPMRIEQRIGRIDRRGQRSEWVSIVNILTEGTVEAEIYQRCLLRIGVFHRALGGTEQILGDLTTELREIADNLALSDADRDARFRQLADNEVARIQELERLEDQQSALFGLTVDSMQSRVDEAQTRWLDPDRLAGLVRVYLEIVLPGRRISLRPGQIATARLDGTSADAVAADVAAAGGHPRFERLLRRKPVVLRLTTDPALGADEPNVELLTTTHPLVLAAAYRTAFTSGAPTASLRVRTDIVPAGKYLISIHAWTRLQVRDSLTLRYIALDPAVEAAADKLLPIADDGDFDTQISPTELSALEVQLHSDWDAARQEHVAHVRDSAAQRVAALRAQRDRQLNIKDANLLFVTDPKIRRMRESERAALQDNYDRMIASVERAASGADLLTRHLATVMLEVALP
jgi:ATP-dependent helicase HepA